MPIAHVIFLRCYNVDFIRDQRFVCVDVQAEGQDVAGYTFFFYLRT